MKLPVNYYDFHYTERWKIRNEYVRRQDGKCHYCKKPLDGPPRKDIAKLDVDKTLFPDGFFNYPVHLHHSHDTGMTIGAVHCHCNAVLWQYEGE